MLEPFFGAKCQKWFMGQVTQSAAIWPWARKYIQKLRFILGFWLINAPLCLTIFLKEKGVTRQSPGKSRGQVRAQKVESHAAPFN